jgi:hypothetical protein
MNINRTRAISLVPFFARTKKVTGAARAVSYKESSNEFVHHGALRMKM